MTNFLQIKHAKFYKKKTLHIFIFIFIFIVVTQKVHFQQFWTLKV